jgi:hypothetical protein
MSTRKPHANTGQEPRRRKSFRLRQDKIDAARAILGTSTDSETIERALEEVELSGKHLPSPSTQRNGLTQRKQR